MIIFIFLVIFLFLFIIYLFASPRLSPIPYFPTNHQDLKLIIKALNLKNDQTIIDLGAGTGTVIFTAASNAASLTTKFVAVEINPILIFILHLRRLLHPNRKNIRIIWADLFKINYSSLTTDYLLLTTFYLYVSPWLLEKIVSKIKKEIGSCYIVSYYYPVRSLKKKPHFALRATRGKEKIIQGKNKIYIYNVKS